MSVLESVNERLPKLLFEFWSASSAEERLEVVEKCRVVLKDADSLLVHQPGSVPVATMQQLLIASYVSEVVPPHSTSGTTTTASSSSSSSQHRAGGGVGSQAASTSAAATERARLTLHAISRCRTFLGWMRRSAATKDSTTSSKPTAAPPTSKHHHHHHAEAGLCAAAQLDFAHAAAQFQLRNYNEAFDSLSAGREALTQLLHACFPAHNGNPPTYLLYFLTVSLAAVYHNLAVVSKHLQRYDASLMWMLHFARVAALVRNDRSPELEELQEPLGTRAQMARQYVIPVLSGMLSTRTPLELVIRVRAISESNTNTKNGNSNNPINTPKKDVRVMAARLAAVQSFAERFLAGAAVDAILATSSNASKSSDGSNNASTFSSWFGFGGGGGGSASKPTNSKSRGGAGSGGTGGGGGAELHQRVDAMELMEAVSPGDTADEIAARMAPISFPLVKPSSSVSKNFKATFNRKVSELDHQQQQDNNASAATRGGSTSRSLCEDVAVALGSSLTNGRITSVSAMSDEIVTASAGGAGAPGTGEHDNDDDDDDDDQRQHQRDAVATTMSAEVRHLLFAGIDFASVGCDHSAVKELVDFFHDGRTRICNLISDDLKLLAVSLNVDSWCERVGDCADDGARDGMRRSGGAGRGGLLDFEAAMQVFCAEFDVLLSPPLVDAVRANALGLYDIGMTSSASAAAADATAKQNTSILSSSSSPFDMCNDAHAAQSGSSPFAAGLYVPKIVGGSGLLSSTRTRQKLHAALPLHVQNYDWVCRFSSRTHGSSFSKLYDKCANCSPVLLVIMARSDVPHPHTDAAGGRDSTDYNTTDNTTASTSQHETGATTAAAVEYSTFGAFIGGSLEPTVSFSRTRSVSLGETFVFRELGPGEVECFGRNDDNVVTMSGANTKNAKRSSNDNIDDDAGGDLRDEKIQAEGEEDDDIMSKTALHRQQRVSKATILECGSERIQVGASGIDSDAQHGAAIYLPAWLRAGSTYPCDTFNSPPLMKNLSSSFTFIPCAVEVYSFGTQ